MSDFLSEQINTIIRMRKKVKDKDALKHLIWTRLNDDNYSRFQKLFSQSRYQTMSEFFREIVCERQIIIYTRDESLDITMDKLTRIGDELNAIGININQVSRKINSTIDKSKILSLGIELSEHLRHVDQTIKEVLPIISQLAKKWLQE